jgi:hypothetical protein
MDMNRSNGPMKRIWMGLLLLAFGGICAAAALALQPSPGNGIMARPPRLEEIHPGCVLVAPFRPLLAHNFEADLRPRAFLVNKRTGKTVRAWSSPYPIFSAKLDEKGNLWALTNMLWDGESPVEVVRLNERSEQTARMFVPGLFDDFGFGPAVKTIFHTQHCQK